MVAQLARELRQDIMAIEDWEVPVFFRYFSHMGELLRLEAEAARPPEPDKGPKHPRLNR